MKNIILCIIVFAIISCEEEISNINLEDEKVVLEGYLYANQPIDSIRISKVLSYSGDGTLETIDNLVVTIENGEESIVLNGIGDGYYQRLDHKVKTDKTYSISFSFQDEEIYAETYVNQTIDVKLSQTVVRLQKIEFSGGFPGAGLGGDIEVVDITWDNADLNYFFVDVENIEEEPEYVNGLFEDFADDIDLPASFFRSEPEITDIYSINSRRELQFFGSYEINVYRLNSEYAALYQTVGSSTLSIQEAPTNVQNGLGIFTAVTPHLLNLEVEKK